MMKSSAVPLIPQLIDPGNPPQKTAGIGLQAFLSIFVSLSTPLFQHSYL